MSEKKPHKCEHKGCSKTSDNATLLNNDGAGWFCIPHHNERETIKASLNA